MRESSRPGTMALTMRLEPGAELDMDHYLIETLRNGNIRLEGSPHAFPVLPILLAHYCSHGFA